MTTEGQHVADWRAANGATERIPEARLWSVCFLILFVRFMLVPRSPYGVFLNLFVIVNFLIITQTEGFSQRSFAAKRVIFLLAVFMTMENRGFGLAGQSAPRQSSPNRQRMGGAKRRKVNKQART